MKAKYLFIILMLTSIILTGKVLGACVVPTENYNVNETITLCNNETRYINTSLNVLNFTIDNVVVYGNGTTLIGNRSGNAAYVNTGINNVTIQDVTFKNFNYGLTSSTGAGTYDFDISNCRIENMASIGVMIQRDGCVVSNCTFINNTNDDVRLDSSSADRNIIQNSFFYNGSNDAIHISSTSGGLINVTVQNNLVSKPGTDKDGVFLSYVDNIYIINNTFRNGVGAIGSLANSKINNLTITDNTWYNVTNQTGGLYSPLHTSNVTGLTFSNNVITLHNTIYCETCHNALYSNNTNNDGYEYYTFGENENNTIQETTTNYLTVRQDVGAGLGYVNFSYNGVKYLTLNIENVSIINQASNYPYNDIKNTSTNSILSSNVDNFSITLGANQQIEVGNYTNTNFTVPTYPSGNVPVNYVSVVYNVSDPDSIFNNMTVSLYDVDSVLLQSKVNYSTNALVQLTNLNSSFRYIRLIARDNQSNIVYSQYYPFTVQGGIITSMTNSSVAIQRCIDSRNGAVNALSELPTWIGLALLLLATAVIIGIVVSGMSNSREGSRFGGNFEFGDMITVVIPIVLTAIFIVLGIIILNNVC